MDAHDRSQLVLDWQDQRASLSGDAELLVLGAADDAQLSIPGTFTGQRSGYCHQIARRPARRVIVSGSAAAVRLGPTVILSRASVGPISS